MNSEVNASSAVSATGVAAGAAGPSVATGRDIAVIGMAARLPEADDLQQFLCNLRDGRDSVRELSDDRIARTSLHPDEQYQLSGFLDDIDTFDHAFFGISKGEAQNMAPEHRLLLQVAYQAVENAGYAPGALEGVRGLVYAADTRIEYGDLVLNPEPVMRMGTHVSAMAGRLSRFFGLRGPATMIDASCSSALFAVHLAINDLLLGDCELAMVCGATINVLADHKTGDLDIGIRSADGKARAFSADAAGTGSGEAVAVVLLKTLQAAIRDGDPVHAVIKATAANNDSSRSSTLTAPDSTAQAEVIELAWQRAGIDPMTISFIEAHGTGTPLGDPIEIEGIDLAFGRVTDRKNFVALSTAKSNIGHTWGVAGLVGLIKVVLSLRARQLFPSLHAAKLNPLIDFANSAVSVTQELTPWEPAAGIRRAGISSFGTIGTNVHAILEEAPGPADSRPREARGSSGTYFVPLSAKSPTALAANAAALRRWIEERPELALPDIERTLTAGRDHHPYRIALTARSLAELADAVAAATPPHHAGSATTVLLLSDACAATPELAAGLRIRHPHFGELYGEALDTASRLGLRDEQFAFQYAFVGVLRHLGLDFAHVVAQSAGKLALDAASGRIPLDEALRGAAAQDRAVPADLDARVDRLTSKFAGRRRVLFAEAGPLSTISGALATRAEVDHDVVAVDGTGLGGFLGGLYTAGAQWRWDARIGAGRRVELPSYQFDRVRCWLDDSKLRTRSVLIESPPAGPATTDPLEAVLAAWRDILGEMPGTGDSFFDLGGDSISSLQVIHSLSDLFAVELDEYAIFDHETPQKLARHIQDALFARGPASGPEGPSPAPFPVSPAQLSIWVAAQFEGGSPAFNLTRSFRIDGQVDREALQQALGALAGRHEALRARFAFADGELTQSTAAAEGFTIPLHLEQPAGARPDDAGITAYVRPFAARPFDLEAGPLARVQLATFAGDEHVLTLSTHHIVVDGWSLGLLVRDLFAFYAQAARGVAPGLPATELGYRDHHVLSRRSADKHRAAASAYWLEQYADVPAGIDLPVRSGVGGDAFSGAYRDYALPDALWERLKRFAKAEGGTAFASVVSTFAALLARYTDQGELVVGTSLSGRGRPGADQLVAMLVRTLPLRVRVDDQAGFRTLFAHVRSQFTVGARHSDYPYEELAQELQQRGLAHSARLFDVLIEFEQFAADDGPLAATSDGGLRATPVDVTLPTSVFPLNIMLSEQANTLGAVIRFDTRLFDARTVDQLWESFTGLLGAVLDHPDMALRQVPHLTEAEQRRVLAIGAHDFDFDASLKIHLAVERFARTSPDRVCLVAGPEQRTYASLNARANRLARFFRDELEVGAEEVVALVMDRSILTVEAILALWKCGGAYLPIDPGYPPSYVRSMLESSRVRVVAVDPDRMTPGLRTQLGDERTVVQLTDSTGADLDAGDLNTATDDTALSYVIYTSGSTGVPKGVMVEHAGMLNHLHAKISDLSLTERSVVAQNASSSFDISVWQMFAAPYAGGRTVVYEASLQLDPIRLGERLDADGVTVLEVVPSYLDAMLDAWARAGRHFGQPALAHLLVTGEAVLPRSVNQWLARSPHVPVVNAYGPTEASDDVTHHVMTRPVTTDTVPLGSPIHNTQIYVLDEHLRVCPQGLKGEIYVSGIGVSRGYLNDPEQTARVFLPDPFRPGLRMYRTGDIGRWTAEGTLQYLGRRDSQVKVRGFRIDLGEIERRVDACPGVKAAAVVTRADDKGRLCAYVVLEPGTTVAECRTVLHGELPRHMVPADFIEIDALPLTSNGKIDRKSLARMEPPRPSAPGVIAPRTESERALAAIWRAVLGADEVGVHDEFFEMGGNSLRAVQILSRIRSQLGVALDLEALFAQPTIAALAAVLEHADGTVNGDEAIASLGGPGSYPVAHTQQLLLGLEDAYDRPDGFNRNDLYELHGHVNAMALELSFARLVERHETLRTTFAKEGGRWMQVVHAPGALPLPFAFHDFAGRLPADARAFALDRAQTAFAVTEEPLVRVDLLRTDAGWLLATSMHQLVSDGRTVDVLVEEWLRLYDAEVAGRDAGLAPLAVQYKDTAQWRNARMADERMREHREFWLQELAGASSLVPLAADRPRPARTAFAAGRVRRPVPGLAARLAGLAVGHGATEFVVATAAVSLLLLAETGARDVTVGTYTRGRNRLDLESQLGNYINTVPLRTRLQPDETVASVLRTAQRAALRALQHEEYPYGWTMRDLGWDRGPDRSPLFDVMVAVDVAEAPEPARAGRHLLELSRLELPRRAKEADLQFVFDRVPGDGMEIAVTYNSEIFDAARVNRWAGRLEEVIEGLAANLPLTEILKREPGSRSIPQQSGEGEQ
jgi:amino acid adenylation domain-containing protein